MRIRSTSTQGAQTSAQTSGGTAGRVPLQADPLAVLLFGKRPPRRLDRRRYAKVEKGLLKVEYLAEEIGETLGLMPEEVSISLAEGRNASITRDAEILMGLELLEEHQDNDDLLVAFVAHELGHQPWTWPRGPLPRMSAAALARLYREEEDKADAHMGRVLADLDANPDPICDFLRRAEQFEGGRSPEYHPAHVRAETIRRAYERRRSERTRKVRVGGLVVRPVRRQLR